jgi:hypothetical protein
MRIRRVAITEAATIAPIRIGVEIPFIAYLHGIIRVWASRQVAMRPT